jgi:hypothetical protein
MLLLWVISLGIKERVFVASTWLVICCSESHEYYTYKHYNYYRYQLNYFICFKDFNAQTITSLKLNLFYFFIYCWKENDLSWYISVIKQTVRYRTPVFTQPFSWCLHITITYNLPHLRLWYVDVVTVI